MTAATHRTAEVSPAQARLLFRAGTITPTAGWAPGYAQANLVVVPADWAYDLLLFAQRNPKACRAAMPAVHGPILEIQSTSPPGSCPCSGPAG